MSKLAQQLKAKLAANLETHAAAEKGFDGFDIYKSSRLESIAISDIYPNPMQPRTEFDEESLQELADNIQQNGLLQPITVRQTAQGYEIVAGERRFRATQLLGKTSIECIVAHITDQQNALLALAENLARKDLSDFETAIAVGKIKDNFENKSELAKSLGISRAKLYKLLAFEELPSVVLNQLKDNPGLLSADTAEQIKSLQKDISETVFDHVMSGAIEMVKSGDLKQSHLCDFVMSQIGGNDAKIGVDRKALKPAEFKAPATSNVKKMFLKDGRQIGKVKADGKKFIVEISARNLTANQEKELMQFLDNLLEA